MKYQEHFHRSAGTIIKNTDIYKIEYESLIETISSITDKDLVEEFYNVLQTQPSKKSLSTAINNLLKTRLTEKGWKAEVHIFRDKEYMDNKTNTWRLDFAKEKISVEVGFNHGGNIAHNLIKPTLAGELNHVEKEVITDIAVIIAATNGLKKAGNFDGAVGAFEKILTYLKPYNQFLTVPTVIIGLEAPETFYIDKKTRDVVYIT